MHPLLVASLTLATAVGSEEEGAAGAHDEDQDGGDEDGDEAIATGEARTRDVCQRRVLRM